MPAVVEIRSGAARRQRSNTAPVGAAGARRGAGQSEGALLFTGPSWSYSSSRRSSGLWRSECRVPVATPASVSTRCRTWSTHCFTGRACVETSLHADCRALWNRRCAVVRGALSTGRNGGHSESSTCNRRSVSQRHDERALERNRSEGPAHPRAVSAGFASSPRRTGQSARR